MPATIRQLNDYRKHSLERVRAGTTNISSPERWISGISGGALVAWGMAHRTVPGISLALTGAVLVYRGLTGYCPLYGALGISTAESPQGGDAISVPYGRGTRVEDSITIGRPVEQVFRFWRDFENLPRFMSHLDSVDVFDDRRSRWATKGPAGQRVEWDGELINEVENKLIGWRSVGSSDVDHAGSVHFEEVPGGTSVRVILRYDPPAGKLGATVATLLGEDPQHQLQRDLAKLKEMLEREQPTA